MLVKWQDGRPTRNLIIYDGFHPPAAQSKSLFYPASEEVAVFFTVTSSLAEQVIFNLMEVI